MSDHSVQSEILRLQCLQTLGIAVYHPRFRLPGAKPSVQGPWADMDVVPRVDVAVPANAVKAVQAEKAVVKKAAPAPQVSPARSTESAPAAVQNFQLLFLQVDDDLAIVNQVPALARPQLQDKQLALLTNLLRWLGKSVPAHAPRVFRWPLPGLEHMAATMDAQTSLLHFLEQAASERGFRFLLQMGPLAAAPAASAWQAFATHSLDEMLALPALKREAWETLLPLHGQLHARS